MKRFTLIMFLSVLMVPALMAQKYGHLNFGNLIASMPQTKSADTQINTFSEQLINKGKEMASALQSEFQKAAADVQAGKIAPANQQVLEQQLQKKQAELQAYEREVQEKVAAKRDELLKPIIEKAQGAIDAVAKEKGYKMIFDSSVFNTILYSNATDDVMPLVKAKLGIQ